MPFPSRQSLPFGDRLLTSIVDEQLTIYRTPNRSRLFYLSSGANELDPPPLYRYFLKLEYDKSELPKSYTNGVGYPPLVKIVSAYETFRSGKQVASRLLQSHSGVITFGAAGGIATAFYLIAQEQPLKVLQIDYSYPIFERAVNQLGGEIYQVLPENPTKPVDAEDAVRAIRHVRPNIVVLNNTSNPTGQSYDIPFLERVFRTVKETGVWIVYDRSCEFDVGPDSECDPVAIALREGIINRLIIVNSISKTCSLPGLRLGWVFSPNPLAENIGQWQMYLSENPSMVGVIPLIVDLWLRMEYMAERSAGGLEYPNRRELAQIFDSDGLIRAWKSRQFFHQIFISKEMDEIYKRHIHHFETNVRIFHHNFEVFKSLVGAKLGNYPATFKGFNVMVSRRDFELKDPVRVTSDLLHETYVSIVPAACFVANVNRSKDNESYFRLSLGTKPSQFRAAVKRFAEWSPK